MTITYKEDYKITVGENSWDLHFRGTHPESKTIKLKGKDIVIKKGDKTGWQDGGYFTSLSSLIEKMIRIEMSRDESTITLGQLVERYKKEREQIMNNLTS